MSLDRAVGRDAAVGATLHRASGCWLKSGISVGGRAAKSPRKMGDRASTAVRPLRSGDWLRPQAALHWPCAAETGRWHRTISRSKRSCERASSRISAVREANVSFATLLARADLHPVISVDVAGGAAPDQLDSAGAPQTRRSRSCGNGPNSLFRRVDLRSDGRRSILST